MARAIDSAPKRPRISIDVDPALHRRLRSAAAERDVTVRQYVLEAITDRLHRDVDAAEDAVGLNGAADPVLAELWDNPNDAAYDRP